MLPGRLLLAVVVVVVLALLLVVIVVSDRGAVSFWITPVEDSR